MADNTIRAAGGVVWRVRDGQFEIAVVHRPRYNDWSLPKGKLDHGESTLAAAVREVGEEIGSSVAVSRRLTRIAYSVGNQLKTVTFWLMRHVDGDFVVSDEVDDLRWLTPAAAADLLSYDIERDVLDELDALPVPDSVIVIVRHASAGKRSAWHGDDAQRPLDATGLAQADRLAVFLPYFAPGRVVSASPVRCVQTVTPAAKALGLDVLVDHTFSDDDYVATPQAAEAGVRALAVPGEVTVVSSQGATIPGLIESFAPGVGDASTKKGAAWVLCAVDGKFISADYYPHAGRE